MKLKALRVLVLMHVDLVPPNTLRGHSAKEIVAWKTEFDVVSTLKKMGHEVQPLGVHDDLGVIRKALAEWQPHIAFNLLEEFHGNPLFDHHIAGYMELMRQPYTGCNPRGLLLAHDKAMCKKIFSFHRIRTPNFAVFPRGARVRAPGKLRYPLFVKSLYEEGSLGIAHASIVSTEDKLRERVAFLHEQLGTAVIAEEYIEGREFYLALIGNERVQALPVLEMEFGTIPEDAPRIATSKIKWDLRYQKRHGIDVKPAVGLDDQQLEKLQRLGRRIYRLLELSGYARIDLRVTEAGEVYVLEANANPDVGYGEELCVAAAAAGIDYPGLLQKILTLGLRYKAELRGF